MQLKPGYEEELQQILSAVQILSADSFTFAGEQVAAVEAGPAPAPSMPESPALVMRLQQHLYQHCYCIAIGSRIEPPVTTTLSADDFLAQLSQANLSRSRWDSNWQVTRVENTGQVWAEKGGIVRMFQPGEFVNYSNPGTPVPTGTPISVYIFKESTALQPGFYFIFGETVMPSNNLDLFRLYWNINAAGVPHLIRLISRDLNRFQVPFQFKSPVWPQGYMRRDAAVLYVKKQFYVLVRDLALAWRQECEQHLRDDVPLFSLRQAQGLGLAEDPETGESFGMNRCRHLAEAIWSAYIRRLPADQRLQAVKEQFQQHGLDINRPYLNATSVNQYTHE